jgi:hypothetical protein
MTRLGFTQSLSSGGAAHGSLSVAGIKANKGCQERIAAHERFDGFSIAIACQPH